MSALPRLIALSSGDLDARAPQRFLAGLEAALEAGLTALLLREPRLPDRAYLALAREAAARLGAAGGRWLGLHDRPHLARALGADAVHLSFRALPPEAIRPWLGPGVELGLSTHAGDDPARWGAADYVFHGPLRPVRGKPGIPVDLAGFAAAARRSSCPLLALGGVRPEDVGALRRAGVHGVAVRSGLLGAEDPAAAARAYLAALA
jgi:thiamine-phosphate diphosphorylase